MNEFCQRGSGAAERRLTANEFQEVAAVPAVAEWFANIDKQRTRRAYQINLEDFCGLWVFMLQMIFAPSPGHPVTRGLRAQAATNALDHDAHIAKVQARLGHAEISTTKIHARRQSRPYIYAGRSVTAGEHEGDRTPNQ